VTSWTAGGVELLFLSEKSSFAPPKPIRGGVPVCWPQFSAEGPLGQHGFARNSLWSLAASGSDGAGGAFCELRLVDSDATRAAGWPHAFALSLRATLRADGALVVALRSENTGATPFSFTTALHTYLRCTSAASTVAGLAGSTYLDSLAARARTAEASDAVAFACEVDRIYLGVLRDEHALTLRDAAAGRTFTVRAAGLPDAVVWNPWIAKAAAMADFGDEEYQQMVCIEAAAIESRVQLAPGEAWTGETTLTVA